MGKILVVDDSSTMRRIIVNTLARLGFKETIQAADGVEAWEAYQKEKDNIDAIITEVGLIPPQGAWHIIEKYFGWIEP